MSTTTNGGSISSSTWTTDELMHGKVGVPSPPVSPGGTTSNGDGDSPSKQNKHHRFSIRKMGHGKKGPPADPMDWGMPGHLTEEEVAVFVSIRCIYICLFLVSVCSVPVYFSYVNCGEIVYNIKGVANIMLCIRDSHVLCNL